jgi:hypothetical protein
VETELLFLKFSSRGRGPRAKSYTTGTVEKFDFGRYFTNFLALNLTKFVECWWEINSYNHCFMHPKVYIPVLDFYYSQVTPRHRRKLSVWVVRSAKVFMIDFIKTSSPIIGAKVTLSGWKWPRKPRWLQWTWVISRCWGLFEGPGVIPMCPDYI